MPVIMAKSAQIGQLCTQPVPRPGVARAMPNGGSRGAPGGLLDVDTGRATPVRDFGVNGPGPVLLVLAAGRDAVLWIDRYPLASEIQ